MRIEFTGARVKRRIVGVYEWSRETGFVQEVVEPDLAAVLLTAPSDDFVVAGDEPLCSLDGVGPERAAGLALAGIGEMGDLVGLSGAAMKRLARETGASERQVKEWVEAATSMAGEPVGAENIETEEVCDD